MKWVIGPVCLSHIVGYGAYFVGWSGASLDL